MKRYHAKRIELHNHTIESDGDFTVLELADYLYEHQVQYFSLTDHNTISGHGKMQTYLQQTNRGQKCLSGYELTSYYGHILCQNIHSYIPWDDIELQNADMLFDRVHAAGGLVGPAHPCSIGAPISNGPQFCMTIHDPSKMDFIEIINNSHPMSPDNKSAIRFWESLYMKGFQIAPVSGIDLHRPRDMQNIYTTYMLLPERLLTAPLDTQLFYAVTHQKTCVTNGPILHSAIKNNILHIELELPQAEPEETDYFLVIKGMPHHIKPLCEFPSTIQNYLKKTELEEASCYIHSFPANQTAAALPMQDIHMADCASLILELYRNGLSIEHLRAIAPVGA